MTSVIVQKQEAIMVANTKLRLYKVLESLRVIERYGYLNGN